MIWWLTRPKPRNYSLDLGGQQNSRSWNYWKVTDFKLLALGAYIDSKLSWSKRLTFLKVLKRSGLPHDYLVHYYTAVIRPVVECCSCEWHHNQWTVITNWIYSKTGNQYYLRMYWRVPYNSALNGANLSSLRARRIDQADHFFQSIMHPSCIRALLPSPRDQEIICKPSNIFGNPQQKTPVLH